MRGVLGVPGCAALEIPAKVQSRELGDFGVLRPVAEEAADELEEAVCLCEPVFVMSFGDLGGDSTTLGTFRGRPTPRFGGAESLVTMGA